MRSSAASSKKSRLSPITKFFIGTLVVFLGSLTLYGMVNPSSEPPDTPTRQRRASQTPRSAAAKTVLRLGDWSWASEYGWATGEGQITNTGKDSLKNVQVVVSWFTKDGTFITSQSAMIEYDPLLSGQTSPWKVMARHNPAMSQARVEFKQMSGGKLTHATGK